MVTRHHVIRLGTIAGLTVIIISLFVPVISAHNFWMYKAYAQTIPSACPAGTTGVALPGDRNLRSLYCMGPSGVLKQLGVEDSIAAAAENAQSWEVYAGALQEKRVVAGRDPSCSIILGTATFQCWIWDPLQKALGQFALMIGTVILYIGGFVFDGFLDHLVVNFQATLEKTGLFDTVIVFGWTLFRDLANIAIIGVFVFVAIMTILGSTNYGAKRLIARVLVVAILINFSLLFTQIIVEGTNFISGQLAQTLPKQEGCDGTAECFLLAFGIKNVVEGTGKVVEQISKGNGSTGAMMYGFVGGIALIGIALVLLYGAFVMAARALLLTFAMLTSSIAFATYLLPNTAGQSYIGWSAWWSNLLKAALFGPLLLLFLTISMRVIQAAGTKGGGDALKVLADNPNEITPELWTSMITLIFATGMLFVAIRAAGSFASSIGGYGTAASLAWLPAAFGARAAARWGRNNLGGRALAKQFELEEKIKEAKKDGRWGDAVMFAKQYDKFATRAKSDFNVMNTAAAKNIAKGLGVSGFALGEKKFGGAAGLAKATAKELAEKYGEARPSNEELDAKGKQAADITREAGQSTIDTMKAQKNLLEEQRKGLEANKSGHIEEQKKIQETRRREVEEDKMMRDLRKSLVETTDAAARGGIRQQMAQRQQQIEAEHQGALNQVGQKITDVHQEINAKLAEIASHDTNLKEVRDNLDTAAQKAEADAVEKAKEGYGQALKKATPFLQRSDAVIRMVDDQFKDKKLRDRMKMLAENIDKDDKGKENK